MWNKKAYLILSLLLKAWMLSSWAWETRALQKSTLSQSLVVHPLLRRQSDKINPNICQTPKAGQRLMDEGIHSRSVNNLKHE